MSNNKTVWERKRAIIDIVNKAYDRTGGNGRWCPSYNQIAAEMYSVQMLDLESKQRVFYYVKQLSEDVDTMLSDDEIVYLKETGEIFTRYIIKQEVQKHLSSKGRYSLDRLTAIQTVRIEKFLRNGVVDVCPLDRLVEMFAALVPKYISYAALVASACNEKIMVSCGDAVSACKDEEYKLTDSDKLCELLSKFIDGFYCTNSAFLTTDMFREAFRYVGNDAYKVLESAQKNGEIALNLNREMCPTSVNYGEVSNFPEFFEKAILDFLNETKTQSASVSKFSVFMFTGCSEEKVQSVLNKFDSLGRYSKIVKNSDGTYSKAGTKSDEAAATSLFSGVAKTMEAEVNRLYDENGAIPSIESVAKKFGTEVTSVNFLVDNSSGILELNDNNEIVTEYIKDNENKKLEKLNSKAAEVVMLPILGPIACGRSESVDQSESEGFWPFPKRELDSRKKYYYLKASGDSMKDAGISDGALVLIEITHEANIGDIVVAKDENEGTTLKRYLEDNAGRPYLHPENKETDKNGNLIYQDMYKDEIDIQGKFAGSVVYMFNS